jgi:glycosyltransferase involved in cell wall biosynthesis
MKVVHLNTYTRGGAAEAALRLHSGLLQKGAESRFLALYKGDCHLPQVYDFREKLSFFSYWLKKFANKNRTLADIKLSQRSGELFSNLSSVWPVHEHSFIRTSDIVHLHWVSNYVDLPHFLKQKHRIVWTLHDHFLFSGGFHYPPPDPGHLPPKKLDEQKKKIRELLTERPIDLVFPSEHLKQKAIASGVVQTCRLHVIKNPVDPKKFFPLSKKSAREKLGLPQDVPVIFFISDLIHYSRKGFSILQKALSLLENEVTVLVAGKGEVPNSIGKAKLKHVGYVSDHSFLNQLYNAADLLVNPSLDDISSNTIIEAMACGRPAVAFHTGGIPELIDEVNGLIAPEKNAQALAASIAQALKATYNEKDIIAKSLREHSPDLIAQKYLEVYAEAMAITS